MLAVTVPVSADTDLKFSGQVRLREQVDKRDFDTSLTWRNWAELRTRVGVDAMVDSNTHAFAEFQDSRLMGGYDQFGHRTSGELNDGKNVDMHQAYIQVDRILVDGLGLKAGRFELNFGNERVFGAVDWSNVGRVWEGGLGWYDQEKFRLTAFELKAIEVNNPYYNADFDIGGLYTTYKPYDLDLFWFYEYDANETGYYMNLNRLDRLNAGLYFKHSFDQEHVDVEVNGVYQWGQEPRGLYNPIINGPKDKIDIAAYMFTAELGYSFEAPFKGRLAAGIDFTSGDDDATDDEINNYDNLYFTAHKFNGYMDYFTPAAKQGRPYETSGLTDIVFRGAIEPNEFWRGLLDVHLFSTPKDYTYTRQTDGTQITSNKVGVEIDGTVRTTVIEGLNLQGGASVMLADKDFMEAFTLGMVRDGDPGAWFYIMSTVNF